MKRAFVLFVMAVLGGCVHTTPPFQKAPLVSFEARDPQRVLERFQASTPASFQLLTTVVFEYNNYRFVGIGNVELNTKDREFKLACSNPMGVKLFELSGDARTITTQYAIAALAKYGDVGAVVGEDIRRIYFDTVPLPEAPVWKRKYEFVYRQSSGPGYLEYVFAGPDGDLVEKRYYEDHLIVWLASYYEYREERGKRYPQGIVYVNYQHGYRLTVRHKEFRS